MRSRRAVTILVIAAAQLAVPLVARASFDTSASQVMSVTTALLDAPTGVSAVRGQCNIIVLGKTSANISWTASSSTQTAGYDILRSTTSGSGYALVGSVVGRTTTTFTDPNLNFSTRYYYVVQSSRNLWRSVNSNQDPVTTQNVACLGGSDT